MAISNLKNYLLISTPGLNDSIFRKSIILLCDHDENGAMGLILNKPIIGLRFFTAYGEWGRPDMFIIKLLNSIYKNKTFYLNNSGDHYRDFTYINDITEICAKLIKKKVIKKHFVFNICASNQVNILNLTKKIKAKFPKLKIKNVKANEADVYRTLGDNIKIKKFIKFKKFTNINYGLKKTIEWYNLYYSNLN